MGYQKSKYHIENMTKARKKSAKKAMSDKRKRVEDYYKNPKKCLQCDAPIEYEKKRENKFCSKSCSATYNNTRRKHSNETKEKVRETLLNNFISKNKNILDKIEIINKEIYHKKSCLECNKDFLSKKRIRKFCSNLCASNYRAANLTPQQREELSRRGRINIKKQAEEGKWKGWSGRSEPSFPEQYIQSLLEKDGLFEDIHYKRELPVSGFFIDFAFEDKMIALEVDGKQHDYPEHAERDERKEQTLQSLGWSIYRLRWYSVKKKSGREKVLARYSEIIDIIKASPVVK